MSPQRDPDLAALASKLEQMVREIQGAWPVKPTPTEAFLKMVNRFFGRS